MLFSKLVTRLYALRNFNVNHVAVRAVGVSSRLAVIRQESMPNAEINGYKPTSMIGVCQEGKSSPDALRRSAV